jgi:uncharacterized flavoprotein (TIGR03862 family)
MGWDREGRPTFRQAGGEDAPEAADALLLSMGGASWPRLGADGAWTATLAEAGVVSAPLRPANCGFVADFSPAFPGDHAGRPLKGVEVRFAGRAVRGEVMLTRQGIEGGAVYAHSAALRDALDAGGEAIVEIDLRPGRSPEDLVARLARTDRKASLSNRLRKALALSPQEIGLLREAGPLTSDLEALAARIRSIPLRLTGTTGLDRAISTAGGVRFEDLDPGLQLRARPGVWIAGEMLDWEAPTGGYLLQAVFATGVHAARDILSRQG